MYDPFSRPLSYAPTPYSYTPTSTLSATISLDEEVKVADSAAERDLVDSLAEIYSIVRTIDGLEKAYIKDAVTEAEYAGLCGKLLKQYRSILSDEAVEREVGDLDRFCRQWELECPRAIERIRIGAVVEPSSTSSTHHPNHGPHDTHPSAPLPGAGASSRLIVAATENFITFLDALKLNMGSKETLHPLLSDVIQSVNRVTERDFENKGKIIQWLIALNQMRMSEELGEERLRELAFDMEQAYNGFKATIY